MIHRWWHLAIRNSRARLARTLAHSLAVVVACALVTCLTSVFSSGESSFLGMHKRWMGAADIQVRAAGGRSFAQEKLAAVARMEGVEMLSGRLHDRAQLVSPAGHLSVEVRGRQLPEDAKMHPQELLQGRQPSDNHAREIIVTDRAAEQLHLRLGDKAQLRIYDRSWDFAVVGIVAGEPLFAFIPQTVQIPLAAAQEVFGRPGQIDAGAIGVLPGSDRKALAERISAELGPEFNVHLPSDRRSMVHDDMPLWRAGVFVLSSIIFCVAIFLVFATQTCGLVQRISEMGTLRCLGATRGQIVRLVLYESIPLALWGMLLGVPAGLLGSYELVTHLPRIFRQGWSLDVWGVALACAGTAASVLVGSILPAIAAARASVIQAYRPRSGSRRRWPVAASALVGAALVATSLWQVYSSHNAQRAILTHAMLGVPMMLAGLFLMLPALLATLGRLVAAVVGAVAGLGKNLLIESILRARWRSSAIAAAIAVCVALVVSAQTQTESLIAGTKLPVGFPDLLVIVPEGVSAALAEDTLAELGVQHWTGVNGFEVETAAPRRQAMSAMLRMLMIGRGGNTWFVAFEPERMEQVVHLEFLEGSAADAMAKLDQGDYVIVPAAFARARGLKLGDKIAIAGQGREYSFEIAGVVQSLSLDAVNNIFDFGDAYSQNAANTVLGSTRTAQRDFGQSGYCVLLIDTAGPQASEQISQELAGRWPLHRPTMLTISLSSIKQEIDKSFRTIANLFSWAAGLLSAAVASLGVANAMRAGVLSRRRELGVLRAVGLTRAGLLRMILSEALVLGVVGSLAGVGAGLTGAAAGLRIHQLLIGLHANFTFPLQQTLLATAMATGAAVAASIWAAVEAGRADVLQSMRDAA